MIFPTDSEEKKVSLNCQARGNPTPTYRYLSVLCYFFSPAFRILATAILLWESMYFGEKQQKQLSDTNGFPDWMLFVILNKREAEVALIKVKSNILSFKLCTLRIYPYGETPFVQFIESCLWQMTKAKYLILWGFLFF